MRPDTQADRALFKALNESDYDYWYSRTTADFEAAGQQELLNWCPLLGAMKELNAPLKWSSFTETHIFNSNKVFAEYSVG